jgi:hypothetical protein
MFTDTSRYAGLPTVTVKTHDSREVTAVKLRRLDSPTASPYTTVGTDRLDVMAGRNYGDGTRFWHLADANTELQAGALVKRPGRVIWVPVQ